MFGAMITIFGGMLFLAGIIFSVYWQVRLLVVTYKYSLWWFLGCLLVPFADWAFLLLHFKIARKPFGMSLIGLAMFFLGVWMAGIGAQ